MRTKSGVMKVFQKVEKRRKDENRCSVMKVLQRNIIQKKYKKSFILLFNMFECRNYKVRYLTIIKILNQKLFFKTQKVLLED